MTLPSLLTVPEIARYLGQHQQTVYLNIRIGRMRAYRIGRHIRVSEDQVRDFLDAKRRKS